MKIWETKYVDLVHADRVLCGLRIYVHMCNYALMYVYTNLWYGVYYVERTNTVKIS